MEWDKSLAERRRETENQHQEDLDRQRWMETPIARKVPAFWNRLEEAIQVAVQEYNEQFAHPRVEVRIPEGSFQVEIINHASVAVRANIHLNSSTDCLEVELRSPFIRSRPIAEVVCAWRLSLGADGTLGLQSENGQRVAIEQAVETALREVL